MDLATLTPLVLKAIPLVLKASMANIAQRAKNVKVAEISLD